MSAASRVNLPPLEFWQARVSAARVLPDVETRRLWRGQVVELLRSHPLGSLPRWSTGSPLAQELSQTAVGLRLSLESLLADYVRADRCPVASPAIAAALIGAYIQRARRLAALKTATESLTPLVEALGDQCETLFRDRRVMDGALVGLADDVIAQADRLPCDSALLRDASVELMHLLPDRWTPLRRHTLTRSVIHALGLHWLTAQVDQRPQPLLRWGVQAALLCDVGWLAADRRRDVNSAENLARWEQRFPHARLSVGLAAGLSPARVERLRLIANHHHGYRPRRGLSDEPRQLDGEMATVVRWWELMEATYRVASSENDVGVIHDLSCIDSNFYLEEAPMACDRTEQALLRLREEASWGRLPAAVVERWLQLTRPARPTEIRVPPPPAVMGSRRHRLDGAHNAMAPQRGNDAAAAPRQATSRNRLE